MSLKEKRVQEEGGSEEGALRGGVSIGRVLHFEFISISKQLVGKATPNLDYLSNLLLLCSLARGEHIKWNAAIATPFCATINAHPVAARGKVQQILLLVVCILNIKRRNAAPASFLHRTQLRTRRIFSLDFLVATALKTAKLTSQRANKFPKLRTSVVFARPKVDLIGTHGATPKPNAA